jgi:hypothetical protein
MTFGMFVVGNRIEEAKGVLAGPRVEAVGKYRVCRSDISRELEFGIADNRVPRARKEETLNSAQLLD